MNATLYWPFEVHYFIPAAKSGLNKNGSRLEAVFYNKTNIVLMIES